MTILTATENFKCYGQLSPMLLWANVVASAGVYGSTGTEDATLFAQTGEESKSGLWYLGRGGLQFDASAISGSVTAATLSIANIEFSVTESLEANLGLYAFTPGDVDAPVAADYGVANWGGTLLSDDTHLVDTTVTKDISFTINAAGLAVLTALMGGKFWLGLRYTEDADVSSPTWVANDAAQVVANRRLCTLDLNSAASVIRNGVPISKLNNVAVASINR